MPRKRVDLCAAQGFRGVDARRELAVDRVEDAMRVLIADRDERADDIVGAGGEKSAAEAQGERLRVRMVERLACREHDRRAGEEMLARDAPPRHPLARISVRRWKSEHRLLRARTHLRVSGDVKHVRSRGHDVGEGRALERLRVEAAHVVQLLAHVRQSHRAATLALGQRDRRQRG